MLFSKLMNLNLRTKIIVVILLTTIIPLSLLGFYIFKYTSNLMQHELSINELQYLESLNKQYAYFLKDVEQMSLFFSKNDALKEILLKNPPENPEEKYADIQEVSELFKTVKGIKEWDMDIYIVGKNGSRFFSNTYLPEKYNAINENWGIFRKMKEHSGLITWDTNYSYDRMYPSDVALTAGRTFNAMDSGDIIGYILIDINENALELMYSDHLTNDDEYFYILDNKGNIISNEGNHKLIGTKLQVPYLNKLLKGDNGYFNYNIHHIPSVVTYHTSDVTGFKLVSVKPLYTIDNKISTIRNLTLSITILAIIISGWLATLLSRTITRPLYKLMELMGEVETGNLHVRFSSKYDDDIGIFGNHFNKMLVQLDQLIKDSYEKKIRIKNSEIKALRAQINPHFLYNTLDTVNWLARLKRTEEISTIVLSLSSIMKYSIRTTEQDFVTLETDVNQLRNYITIQKFRYRDKIDVHLFVDEHLLNEPIPSLLVQPLVENSIIHGQENNKNKGNIDIHIQTDGTFMCFTIKDDGVGIEPTILQQLQQEETEKLSNGIGIENVKQRIKLYYGNEYVFKIDSEVGKGTTIVIKLPFKGDERRV